jgi:hypothetical protein
MRRAVAFPLVGATVVALAVSGTLFAYANWTIPGTATVKTRVLPMPRGVTPSVAKHGTQAIVSWSSQELTDGVPMQRYVITAYPADGSPVIHTVTAADGLTQSTTFTTAELAGARWSWTLSPVFATWTGEPSEKTDKLTFPAAATTSLVADAPAAKTAADSPPPDAGSAGVSPAGVTPGDTSSTGPGPAGPGPAGPGPATPGPAGTSPGGTSPDGTSPGGTSPGGASSGETAQAAAAPETPPITKPAESSTTSTQADPMPSKSTPTVAGAAPDSASPGNPAS